MRHTMNSRDEAILEWWKSISDRENSHQRAARAALRRCRTPEEVQFQPAFHALRHKVKSNPRQLAVVAGVLAHVDTNADKHDFAAQLARPAEKSDRARFSGLRFRRLLKVQEPGELMTQVIHAVRILGRDANVPDLARGLWFWNDRTRKEWAFAYYDHAPKTEP